MNVEVPHVGCARTKAAPLTCASSGLQLGNSCLSKKACGQRNSRG